MVVIFDLGRVVVRWDPEAIVSSVRGPDGAKALAERLFDHPDWLAVDRGVLSIEAMAEQAVTRTGLTWQENLAILQAVPASLIVDPFMEKLIADLHQAGHTLYALSNMGHASIEWLEQQCDFWRYFSGKVVSARVRMMKPEADIYRYLLTAFDLQPQDCLFIDDSLVNVEAAQALGIKSIQFNEGKGCRAQLVKMSYLVD